MAAMDMDKIRDEMAKAGGKNPAVEAIGEYVTERLRKGAAILEGRTLAGAYKAMESEARKRWEESKATGAGCVCIAPMEAEKIVSQYFGWTEEPQAPAEEVREKASDLDLDALLGGL